jgi:hypothetical protein
MLCTLTVFAMTERLFNQYELALKWNSLQPREKLIQYFGWLREYNREFDFLKGANIPGGWSPLGCGPLDDWPDMIDFTHRVGDMISNGHIFETPVAPPLLLREMKGFAQRVASTSYAHHEKAVAEVAAKLESLMNYKG